MKPFFIKICGVVILLFASQMLFAQATYVGSQKCQTCHSTYVTDWQKTLHSKIHLIPSSTTVTGDFVTNTTISMGSSYGNATVTVRTSAGKHYAKVGASGTEYEIAFTYGFGWKQRYLVKIGESYYILPIQWNSNKYLDNSTGSWTTYTQSTWFNSDGTVKATTTNSFRKKSWDKNCFGCHVTGYSVSLSITGTDTSWVGNWANKSTDPSTDIVVGCESCHGPGSTHIASPSKDNMFNPEKDATSNARKLDVCGQCHFRGSSYKSSGTVAGTHEYAYNEDNKTYYIPGDDLSKFIRRGTPNATGGRGLWPDAVTARQHHQQNEDFQLITNKHNSLGTMNCWTCHDTHKEAGNPHQLKSKADDNSLCTTCHSWALNVDKVKKHTNHKTYDPTNQSNTGGTGRCVKCHMAYTAVTAKAFDISSHTFKVIPPKATLDYKTSSVADLKGNINSCAVSCHRNATGSIPTFGVGTDANLKDWTETTDITLADSLNKYFTKWTFPVSIGDRKSLTPVVYRLDQNYPNPFNPTTRISFELKESGKVTLQVFNILGQEVARIVDGKLMSQGKHTVEWKAVNVSSGVYLYKLTTSKFTATRKMIVMK
jgi:predicted CXXCH cytochrome family protein